MAMDLFLLRGLFSFLFNRQDMYRTVSNTESLILETGTSTTGATSGAGTAYPSGVPEFTPGF